MHEKPSNLEAYYGLPQEVKFCAKCCYSNQRPSSQREINHTKDTKKVTLAFDKDGVCDACRFAEKKESIDWKERERQLVDLLAKHRRNDGSYDCIVPGSGGKDSVFASHMLKYKYGMHPLTVTWPPIMYTDYGYRNFRNWIDVGGFDNISFNQNGKTIRTLTRLSIENLFNVTWREAQFYYTSRLPGEPAQGVNDIHYTPGNPRTFLGGLAFRF